MKPSNNWIADMEACANEAGIINPHAYNNARAQHAERCSQARRAVRKAAEEVRVARNSAYLAAAKVNLKAALEALAELEYGVK